MSVVKSTTIDITNVVKTEFVDWCKSKIPLYNDRLISNVTDKSYSDFVYSFTLKSVYLDSPDDNWFLQPDLVDTYEVIITNPGVDDESYFKLYRHDSDKWRFGIQVEDVDWIPPGTGMARLLMTILVFQTYRQFDPHAIIGICADASNGFWEYIGMREGRLTEDRLRIIHMGQKDPHFRQKKNALTRQICGYDRTFRYLDLISFIGYKRTHLKQ